MKRNPDPPGGGEGSPNKKTVLLGDPSLCGFLSKRIIFLLDSTTNETPFTVRSGLSQG
jgi:hypothetical protein